MKTFLAALLAALLLVPALGRADDLPQGVEPTGPAPGWIPPPPGEFDVATEEVAVQPATPSGQWVFTSQYGWVWMPYANGYTYLPASGAAPNMYVYYPAVGWSWVIAPWVWGFGPRPWFGYAGWGGYGWYGYGYGRWNGFARPYASAGWVGGGYYARGRWNGVGPGYRAPPGGGAPPPRSVGSAPPTVRPGGGSRGTAAPPSGRPVGVQGVAPGRGGAASGRSFTPGGSPYGARGPALAAAPAGHVGHVGHPGGGRR